MAMACSSTAAAALRVKPNPTPVLCHHPSLPPSLVRLSPPRRAIVALRASCTTTAPSTPSSSSLLSGSTRTLSSLLNLVLSASRVVVSSALRLVERSAAAASPSPDELAALRSLQGSLAWAVGPLFFAARRLERPSGYLNTPLTVVASGMARWLDIYGRVLMVRVLLSWFPNIPWDRQPLSAIRDLCDPYLNLFRNIIPPVFDTLDVSPILAFMVLGALTSILHASPWSF